jgi:hypothetical protein
MKDLSYNFWKWVKHTFAPHYRNEIEAYLAESVSHYDLEHRMKVLMHRGMI